MKTLMMLLLAVLLGNTVKGQERPIVVDNSKYFPPTRAQLNLGNCTHFSLVYYLKSAAWNEYLKRDPRLEENQFSHSFVWNQNVEKEIRNHTFNTAAYFMQNFGAVNIVDFPLDEINDEVQPSSELQDKALFFKTKNLVKFKGVFPDGYTEPAEKKEIFIKQLKDSLIKNVGFGVEFSIFEEFYDVKFHDVYNFLQRYNTDELLIRHAVIIVGYNDTIKTANGYGAFLAINSHLDSPMFYFDYDWFRNSGGIGEAYFLREDFNAKPELALHINLRNSVRNNNYYGSDFIFTYSLLDKEGRKVDFINREDYVAQKNLVQVLSVNGKKLPNAQRVVLPAGSSDGNYNIINDVSDLVSASSFESMEVVVLNPVSAEFINEKGVVIRNYTREANFEIEKSYLSFIGKNQNIEATVSDLSDTTVVLQNYYSLQAYRFDELGNEDHLTNGVPIKKSTSVLARKLITFKRADLKSNTAPVFTNSIDSISLYKKDVFSFQFKANDVENDSIVFSIAKGQGASINPKTGLFEYLALDAGLNDEGKTHEFAVRVSDGLSSTSHSFKIRVEAYSENLAPQIVNAFQDTTACERKRFTYQFSFFDREKDELAVSLSGPSGSYLNDGLFIYDAPDLTSINKDSLRQEFVVSISDGTNSVKYNFDILVKRNTAPKIINLLDQISVYQDSIFSYKFEALDVDGDPVSFYIISGVGASVGRESGLFKFSSHDIGTSGNGKEHAIHLRIESYLYSIDYRFNILVKPYIVIEPNSAPVITNPFDSVFVYVDSTFNFEFKAEDADDDNIVFSIVEGGGASINEQTGMFNYVPSSVGTSYFTVKVSDGKDSKSYQFKIASDIYTSTNSIRNENKPKMIVYPNPCRDIVNFEFNSFNNSHVKIEIFDLSGRLVLIPLNREVYSNEQNAHYDISSLKTGIYICRLTADGKFLQSVKLIKD